MYMDGIMLLLIICPFLILIIAFIVAINVKNKAEEQLERYWDIQIGMRSMKC